MHGVIRGEIYGMFTYIYTQVREDENEKKHFGKQQENQERMYLRYYERVSISWQKSMANTVKWCPWVAD